MLLSIFYTVCVVCTLSCRRIIAACTKCYSCELLRISARQRRRSAGIKMHIFHNFVRNAGTSPVGLVVVVSDAKAQAKSLWRFWIRNVKFHWWIQKNSPLQPNRTHFNSAHAIFFRSTLILSSCLRPGLWSRYSISPLPVNNHTHTHTHTYIYIYYQPTLATRPRPSHPCRPAHPNNICWTIRTYYAAYHPVSALHLHPNTFLLTVFKHPSPNNHDRGILHAAVWPRGAL
jgi:hypothetical protein